MKTVLTIVMKINTTIAWKCSKKSAKNGWGQKLHVLTISEKGDNRGGSDTGELAVSTIVRLGRTTTPLSLTDLLLNYCRMGMKQWWYKEAKNDRWTWWLWVSLQTEILITQTYYKYNLLINLSHIINNKFYDRIHWVPMPIFFRYYTQFTLIYFF